MESGPTRQASLDLGHHEDILYPQQVTINSYERQSQAGYGPGNPLSSGTKIVVINGGIIKLTDSVHHDLFSM